MIENNNVMKFGYEDTDKKIEIDLFGIRFEINLNDKKREEISKLEDTEEGLKKAIDEMLGENSVKKINDKRKEDGYKEMDFNILLNVVGCIMTAYTTATAKNVVGKVNSAIEEINKNNSYNREIRRYNNYRKNRRNWR